MPVRNEFFEFGIWLIGKHNFQGGIDVAAFRFGDRHALSSDAQHSTRIGTFRYRHRHGTRRCRHSDLAAQHSLFERDRQVHVDVVVFALEDRVRANGNLDEGIARLAAAARWLAPPTKAQHLTVTRTRRNPDIDSPVPKLDSFRRAIDGIEKINLKR